MENRFFARYANKHPLNAVLNQRGAALLVAILISAAVLAMVMGTLHFVSQSTVMSGAGKRYATAEEVADGAVNAVKDSINLVLWGEEVPAGTFGDDACITNAIFSGAVCSAGINLAGLGTFTATVTVQRLYSTSLPGGRLEFARGMGGGASTAVVYRITATVQDNTNGSNVIENSVVYRFAG